LIFLWNVLRVYSWIFQTILCGMAILVSVAALVTGTGPLDIPWILFPPDRQIPYLIGLGVLGLFFVVLAVAGKFRFLLWLFSIHSAYMLIKGLMLSTVYSFSGPVEARNAAIVCAGAFLASIGSFPISANSRVR
jgi:hypothetical protein